MIKMIFLLSSFSVGIIAGAFKPDEVTGRELVSLEDYYKVKYAKIVSSKALQAQMTYAQKLLKDPKTASQGQQMLQVMETAFSNYNPFPDRILRDHYLSNGDQEKAWALVGKLAINGDPDAQFTVYKTLKDAKKSLPIALLKQAAEPKLFEKDGKSFYFSHLPAQLALVPFYAQKKEEEAKAIESFDHAYRHGAALLGEEFFGEIYSSDAYKTIKELSCKKGSQQHAAKELVKKIEPEAFKKKLSNDPIASIDSPEDKNRILQELEHHAFSFNDEKALLALVDLYFEKAEIRESKKQQQDAFSFEKKGMTLLRKGAEKFPMMRWELIKKLAQQENGQELRGHLKQARKANVSPGKREVVLTALEMLNAHAKKDEEVAYQLSLIYKNGMSDCIPPIKEKADALRQTAIDKGHALASFEFLDENTEKLSIEDRVRRSTEILSHLSPKNEDCQNARNAIIKFLEENKEYPQACYCLAKEYAALGQKDKALLFLLQAQLQSDEKSMQSEFARQAFSAVESLKDKHPEVLKTLGMVRFKRLEALENTKDKIKELDETQRMKDKHPEVLKTVGTVRFKRLETLEDTKNKIEEFDETQRMKDKHPEVLKTVGTVRFKRLETLEDTKDKIEELDETQRMKDKIKELDETQRMIDSLKQKKIECNDLELVQNKYLRDVALALQDTDGVMAEKLLTIAWEKNNSYPARQQWWKMRYAKSHEDGKKTITANWLTEVVERNNSGELFQACQTVIETYARSKSIIDEQLAKKVTVLLEKEISRKPLEVLAILDRWCRTGKHNSGEKLVISLPNISSYSKNEQLVMRAIQAELERKSESELPIIKEMIESKTPEGYAFAALHEKNPEKQKQYIKNFDEVFDTLNMKSPFAINVLGWVIIASLKQPGDKELAHASIKAALHYPLVCNDPAAARILKFVTEDLDHANADLIDAFVTNAQLVNKVCDHFSKFPESVLLRGRLYLEQGQLFEAEKHLLQGQILTQEQKDQSIESDIKRNLAKVFTKKAEVVFEQNKELTAEVEGLLRKAAEYDPNCQDAFEKLVIFSKGRSDNLQKCFDFNEFQAFSGNAKLAHNLGYLYHYGGEYLLHNDKSIKILPDPQKMKKLYEIASRNGHAESSRVCGMLSVASGHFGRAEDFFKKAIEQGSQKAAFELGAELFKTGRVKEALPYLNKSFSESGPSWRSDLFLGAMYALGEKVPQSDEMFVKKMRNFFFRISSDILTTNDGFSEFSLLKDSIKLYELREKFAKYAGNWKTYFDGHLMLIEAASQEDLEKKSANYQACKTLFEKATTLEAVDVKYCALLQLAQMAYGAAATCDKEGAPALENACMYTIRAMRLNTQDVDKRLSSFGPLLSERLALFEQEKAIDAKFVSKFRQEYNAWLKSASQNSNGLA
ncbi:hypothetical protein HYX58_03745 [Candidatus Dependentiae bacterium]|nr:hypothetical protein [Candidatus Dependentiae bacterium]